MTFLLDRSGPDYSRSRPCVCAMSLLGDLRESGSIYTGGLFWTQLWLGEGYWSDLWWD